MKLLWTEDAWDDYLYWLEKDREMVRRVNRLIQDTRRDPFRGLGKPEPLRGDLAGWWSRRIAADHRLVCRVLGKGDEQRMKIAACRYHYGKGAE